MQDIFDEKTKAELVKKVANSLRGMELRFSSTLDIPTAIAERAVEAFYEKLSEWFPLQAVTASQIRDDAQGYGAGGGGIGIGGFGRSGGGVVSVASATYGIGGDGGAQQVIQRSVVAHMNGSRHGDGGARESLPEFVTAELRLHGLLKSDGSAQHE